MPQFHHVVVGRGRREQRPQGSLAALAGVACRVGAYLSKVMTALFDDFLQYWLHPG
jgi:hypothetical protein